MTAPPPPGTTDAAPRPAVEGEARTFPCPQCGADLEFSVGAQSLECGFCGFRKELAFDADETVHEQDLASMLARLEKDHAPSAGEMLSEVRCDSCGAQVAFTGTLTSQDCPYCGVPLQLENAHQRDDRIRVDGVLPFQVDRAQARSNLAHWVKGLWFAPNDFKKRGVQGRFAGVYLPYWTFDSLTSNRYSGMRGDYYYVTVGSGKNRKRVRRTRWSPASGAFQLLFDDVLVVAGDGLPQKRLRDLEPWRLEDVKPFRPELLSGFLARTYDIELPEGFERGKSRMADAIDTEVRRRIGGDTQQVHTIDTRYDAVTFKHLLLPVWMLSYTFKEKAHQVVVNASTGEVQGDRPWSAWKIAGAVLGAVALVAVIVWLTR